MPGCRPGLLLRRFVFCFALLDLFGLGLVLLFSRCAARLSAASATGFVEGFAQHAPDPFILFVVFHCLFSLPYQTSNMFGAIHYLADVGEASGPFGILGGTFTFAVSLFQHNSIHDGGSIIRHDILLDVGDGVTEAITD